MEKFAVYGMYGIYAVIVFGLLVLAHELGHFTIAKLVGVQVYEFSIGFGPRLLGFKKGGTAYNVRAVPLGGFVRMAGMDPEEDRREAEQNREGGGNTGQDKPETGTGRPETDTGQSVTGNEQTFVDPARSFMHKTVLQRMAIIVAGPLMNFVLPILLFTMSIWISGIPVNQNIVGKVMPDRPALEAGIKSGDIITQINGQEVRTWEDIINIIHRSPEKEISIKVVRDGEQISFRIIPQKDVESQRGLIGITPETRQPGVFESLRFGTVKTYEMLNLTVVFLGKIVSKEMPVELSGPVRITYELGRAAEMGIENLIFLGGFLSIQIGLFNLLPIPALDGSRLIFLGLEGIRGTPIDPSKENFIHLMGLAFLLLVMVVITYQDIAQMLS